MVSSNAAFQLYLWGPVLWYLVFWQNLVPNYLITLNNLAFLVHGINTVCHELLKKYNEKQMRKSSFTCKVRFHVRGMEQEVEISGAIWIFKTCCCPSRNSGSPGENTRWYITVELEYLYQYLFVLSSHIYLYFYSLTWFKSPIIR